MVRRLKMLPPIISLILCLATVALWVRSRTACDQFKWDRCDPHARVIRQYRVTSDGGAFYIERIWHDYNNSDVNYYDASVRAHWAYNHPHFTTDEADRASLPLPPRVWELLGFAFFHDRRDPARDDWWAVSVPYWFLTLALALPASKCFIVAGRTFRRRLRVRAGLCSQCGYDLRATPDRCPECGLPAPATARDSALPHLMAEGG